MVLILWLSGLVAAGIILAGVALNFTKHRERGRSLMGAGGGVALLIILIAAVLAILNLNPADRTRAAWGFAVLLLILAAQHLVWRRLKR